MVCQVPETKIKYTFIIAKGYRKDQSPSISGGGSVKRRCLGRLEGEWDEDLGVAGRSTEQKEEEQRVRERVGATTVGRTTDPEEHRGGQGREW